MLAVCSCLCGSTDKLLRGFLNKSGYKEWMEIDIYKGKEKTKKLLDMLPQYPEIGELRNFVEKSSKWAVIIGFDGQFCKWADISRGGVKAKVDAEIIIQQFGN